MEGVKKTTRSITHPHSQEPLTHLQQGHAGTRISYGTLRTSINIFQ